MTLGDKQPLIFKMYKSTFHHSSMYGHPPPKRLRFGKRFLLHDLRKRSHGQKEVSRPSWIVLAANAGWLHSCAKATKQPATNRAVAVAGNLYQTLEMLPFIQSSAFMSEVLHGMFCSCLLYNSVIPKMSLFFHSLHSLRDSQFLQESIGINRLLLGICLNHNLPYLQYPFECQLANPALFSLATLCRNEA